MTKLANAGVGGRVRCLVAGDEVPHSKPAPDIYLEAARRLAVPPAGCVAVEDSDAGVAAAHAAGMRVVVVPDLKAPSERSVACAWRVCRTLHDVVGILAAERRTPAAS